MPTRDIKESCRTSRTLAQVSDFAERLFWRLLTYADDFGRFPADASVVRAQCFSVMIDAVRENRVVNGLMELAKADLIRFYEGDDQKTYGFFPTWSKHQRTRAKFSKYPAPADVGRCRQMPADVAVVTEDTEVPEEPEKTVGRNGHVVLTDDQFLASLRANPAYRGLDLDRELGRMDAWLLTPKGRGRKKTRQFVVNWLNKIDRPLEDRAMTTPHPGIDLR